MWPFEDELIAHFEGVKERHRSQDNGEDGEMEENELSPRRRRR
jgi:hypothetical protein